ncbi:TolC family protein [Sulfidibacter corallicola]|uniref:TolC family protein n=1 Tax=Sulfidibacter corallicola TaxID=2818388 RepID=A0A8A4TX23_SULCO|nr:TolC family protein [Sulfidibacter corallicola]QTD54030.1 TolC family protein [Sulfidibacter corallicola]
MSLLSLLLAITLYQPEGSTLTLDDALTLALRGNRDLMRAGIDLENAHTRVALAKDVFSLQVNSGLSASGEDDSDESGTFSVTTSKKLRWGTQLTLDTDIELSRDRERRYDTDYQLTLSQPLLARGGRIFHEKGLREARIGLDDSHDRYRVRAQQTVQSVVRTYYEVLFQQRSIEFARKSLERLTQLEEATRIKLNIGRVSQVDLYRVRLSKNRTELDLARGQTDLEGLLRELSDLLGQPTDTRHRLVAPEIPTPKVVDVDAVSLLDDVNGQISHRILVRDQREAELELKLARNAMMPDLTLEAAWFADDIEDVAGFDDLTDHGARFSLRNTYSFNQRRNRANLRFAENRLRSLSLDLTDFRMNYERAVLDRLKNLEFLEKDLNLSEQNLAFSEQQLDVAKIRFERGLIDSFDVIEAEENVLVAANDLERAHRNLVLAWLSLKIFVNRLDPETATSRELLRL